MDFSMLRPYTEITIQQITNSVERNGNFIIIKFNFCHSFEVEETWTSLTNKGKLTLPKNVYIIDGKTGDKKTG